jgi:hypothetical protein
MKTGRPTSYDEEILKKTREYIESCEDEEIQQLSGLSAKGTELYKQKLEVHLPTIEGLARYLGINKDTIYEWCKEHKDFSDDIDELRAKQAEELVNKGLSGDYNSTIAKLLLSKHGYKESTETDITSGGEKLDNTSVDVMEMARQISARLKDKKTK